MLNQIRCPYCMETIDLSNERLPHTMVEKVMEHGSLARIMSKS